MPRLVTFGCSFTYGAGLEDTYEFKPGPSVYAWPNITATELNVECVNKGIPGIGNKEILHHIQSFEFQKDDIVCILWTYQNRWCILKQDDDKIVRFISRATTKLAKFYFQMMHDPYDIWLDSFTRMNFAKLYLDHKGITNLHFAINSNLNEKIPNWSLVNFENIYMDDYRFKHRLGLDDAHPGELAHREFGMDVANIINRISVVDNQQ